MRRGEGRDGLPCLAELRQSIAETEIAKRMARDAPPMSVSDVSVRDEPIEKFRAALESIGDESVIPLDDRKP